MQALQNWTISGKASFSSPEDSASVTLKWEHRSDHWQLRGSGSFGRGSFRAEQNDNGALLWQAGQKEITGSSVAELLREHAGLDLPLTELQYWIKGLSAPGLTDAQELNQRAEFVRLVQKGWEVRYLTYKNWGDLRLPTKIFINGKSMKLRLVIHQWEFPKDKPEQGKHVS